MLRKYLLPKYLKLRWQDLFRELESLRASQYFTRAELLHLQEEKLHKLIRFVYENVPYYRAVFAERRLTPSDFRRIEDLPKLPILTKQQIKNDFPQLMPATRKPPAFMRRTSGSTGSPYKVMIDESAALVESALFYRFLFSIGYEWGDEIIKLWGGPIVQPDNWAIAGNIKRRMSDAIWNHTMIDTYNLEANMVSRLFSLLQRSNRKILRGYVSSVYAVALEILRAGVAVQVKALATTAERLFDYQRSAIEKAFQQKVYDQYGCGESNSLAFECEAHNGLHLASEHVILELVDNNGDPVSNDGMGRVLITDLDNYAMPLLRYQNDDLARWSPGACRCGRGSQRLHGIDGRVYEMLTVPGGKKIHGGFFDEIYIEMKFGDKYLIDDLRVVQEDLYNYRLEFVMRGSIDPRDVEALKQKYRQYLGDVNVKIHYVDSIAPTATGKRMFIIPQRQASDDNGWDNAHAL